MKNFLRTIVIATSVALLGAAASFPSYAGDRIVSRHGTRAFDGTWSILLETTRGSCPSAVRAGVRILDGRVLSGDQSYELGGRVAPSGAVQVTVSAAGQTGGASGRLSRAAGRGRWRTSSGECAGQWTAARRG
jgi:hypothetical protein